MKKGSLTGLGEYIVVARAEGVRLGTVADVFVDQKNNQMAAITIRTGVAEDHRMVIREQVEVIGQDVILIRSVSVVADEPEEIPADWRRFTEIREMPVATTGGRVLGRLVDIDIDKAQGVITDLFLHTGLALAVTSEDLTIGPDQLVLPLEYEDRLVQPTDDRRSFFSKIFRQDTMGDVAAGIRRAFRGRDETAGEPNDSEERARSDTDESA